MKTHIPKNAGHMVVLPFPLSRREPVLGSTARTLLAGREDGQQQEAQELREGLC